MQEIVIDKKCLLIRHGHVQRAGTGWNGNDALWYHVCVLVEGARLKDAVGFAYGNSLRHMPTKKKQGHRP